MSRFSDLALDVENVRNEIQDNKENNIGIEWHNWLSVIISNNQFDTSSLEIGGIAYAEDNNYNQVYIRYADDALVEYVYTTYQTEAEFEQYCTRNPHMKYELLYDAEVGYNKHKDMMGE